MKCMWLFLVLNTFEKFLYKYRPVARVFHGVGGGGGARGSAYLKNPVQIINV